MPRRPRAYVPDIPVHVVQRGVNRQDCFFDDEDRRHYLSALAVLSKRFGVQVHAYVLMTNHVHLLLTPADEHGISRMIQSLGRIYVRAVNDRQGRTGTLWEGRHRDSLIDSDRYLLACHRYIEMNPVRAGIVDSPRDYRWSSYRTNASGVIDALITPHELYLGLGRDAANRAAAYRALFQIDDRDTVQVLREGLRRNFPVGGEAFIQRLKALGSPLGRAAPGRPLSQTERGPAADCAEQTI